jgi:hypothetical protein
MNDGEKLFGGGLSMLAMSEKRYHHSLESETL